MEDYFTVGRTFSNVDEAKETLKEVNVSAAAIGYMQICENNGMMFSLVFLSSHTNTAYESFELPNLKEVLTILMLADKGP